MLTKQLNVSLPEVELKRLKKDSVELGITLNDYVLLAFRNFIAKPIACRRAAGKTVKPKLLGRKVS